MTSLEKPADTSLGEEVSHAATARNLDLPACRMFLAGCRSGGLDERVFAQPDTLAEELISTVLMSYAAVQVEGHIRLEWTLAEIDGDTIYSVLRSSAPEWRFEGLEGHAASLGGLSFSFTDETCRTGSSYRYRVDYQSTGGNPRTLFETRIIPVRAIATALHQNYPNPFNPPTAITFVVPGKEAVSLSVYDVTGKLVRVLVDSPLSPGPHEAIWDGRDRTGRAVSTGVYFSRLQVGDERLSRKLVLVR